MDRFSGGCDFKQLKDNWLVFAKHVARGDPEAELVSDLTGSAGNNDSDWLFHPLSPVRTGLI